MTLRRLPSALACLLFVAVAAPLPAAAQDVPPSAAETAPEGPSEAPAAETAVDADRAPDGNAAMLYALSPLVADVQVVGPWTQEDRNGIWRTITLQPEGENAGNRFFVQQIEEVDGAPAVSSSTEITEIGELAGAIVSYRVDAPTPSQPELLTLFFDIVPLDGEIAETYELFYTADEPYIFGPASN